MPAGSHYMEKMIHEANSPTKPPNSPQGVQAPSPSSSSRRPRSSSAFKRRSVQRSLQKPAWDSWGFSKLPSEADGTCPDPGAPPTRDALKALTASWLPTRKGFVKPELARSNDGFSHSHRHKTRSKHANSQQRFPSRASKAKGKGQLANQDKAQTECDPAAVNDTRASVPHSFLQPILHSQSRNVLPGQKGDTDTESKQSGVAQSGKVKSKRKTKGGSRKAAQRAQHAAVCQEEQGQRPEQTLPRVIATDSAQGQSRYVSPVQSPHRRRPQSSGSPAVCDSSFIIMPGSAHGRNQAEPVGPAGSAQHSPAQRSG